MALHLKNPHSVLAAIETRPKDVQKIILPSKISHEGWERVERAASQKKIPIARGGGGNPKDMRSSRGPQTQESSRMGAAEAMVLERSGVSVEELFSDAGKKAGGKGVWLALDCLQDPQNVGAIFRTAAFFGVQGILLTQERSASLTSVVYDIASGGLEYIPFSIQTNLKRAFEVAKESGLWILGTSEHASDSLFKVQNDRPWLLVLGNEEKGMRRLTEESCDVLCKIPGPGKVTSLNVSVAAGISIGQLTRS